MRVAALYDVHGNRTALEAVLADAERAGVDAVVFGGDVVSGPLPRETLERARALAERAHWIRGNADREVASAAQHARDRDDPAQRVAAWAASKLSDEQRGFLAALPEHLVLEVDGLGPTLFCHGSPRSDEEIITPATSEARLQDIVDGVRERVVVCGHTHMQFDRVVGDVRVVNAGSVGMPYEGEPGAYWALLGPSVELRRTAYDFERAAEVFRASAAPDAENVAAIVSLAPVSRDEATSVFEQRVRERGY